ncbi:hypothetical protein B0T25DRAFT_516671 [Lasiosphaeria hispida]|uniref:Uncharacterized protein n=1 Tax=Lasiosphaeria hispida TaxID=260671 RepID=A0AAJ0HM92_9PEZI|nr:hypothetical protein B0T25DRAFT_516671 [Lasiosphaeria hispida]
MPAANPTASASVLPDLSTRNEIEAQLEDLATAIASHPKMQAPNRHPTLFHTWDFVMRTKYILSELDNVEAGRPIRFPEQISDYRSSGAPQPDKAREFMRDVFTRTTTANLMVNEKKQSMMLMMMGLSPIEFGDAVKAKAKAAVDAFEGIPEL